LHHNPFESLDDAGVTRVRALARMLGVSVQTIYNWAHAGRLPKPMKFGPNSSGFPNRALKECGAKWAAEAAA
jgi:excisionase family DNA binding protein